jgi:hypothetical protein
MDAGDGRNSMYTEPQSGGLIDYKMWFDYAIVFAFGVFVGRFLI